MPTTLGPGGLGGRDRRATEPAAHVEEAGALAEFGGLDHHLGVAFLRVGARLLVVEVADVQVEPVQPEQPAAVVEVLADLVGRLGFVRGHAGTSFKRQSVTPTLLSASRRPLEVTSTAPAAGPGSRPTRPEPAPPGRAAFHRLSKPRQGALPTMRMRTSVRIRGTTVIHLFQPQTGDEELAAVAEVFADKWLGHGPRTKAFEAEFAAHIGVDPEHMIFLNSGTAALFLALECLGLEEGDEVVLPSLSFLAAANARAGRGRPPGLLRCGPPHPQPGCRAHRGRAHRPHQGRRRAALWRLPG